MFGSHGFFRSRNSYLAVIRPLLQLSSSPPNCPPSQFSSSFSQLCFNFPTVFRFLPNSPFPPPILPQFSSRFPRCPYGFPTVLRFFSNYPSSPLLSPNSLPASHSSPHVLLPVPFFFNYPLSPPELSLSSPQFSSNSPTLFRPSHQLSCFSFTFPQFSCSFPQFSPNSHTVFRPRLELFPFYPPSHLTIPFQFPTVPPSPPALLRLPPRLSIVSLCFHPDPLQFAAVLLQFSYSSPFSPPIVLLLLPPFPNSLPSSHSSTPVLLQLSVFSFKYPPSPALPSQFCSSFLHLSAPSTPQKFRN